jgi:hypothetical protein
LYLVRADDCLGQFGVGEIGLGELGSGEDGRAEDDRLVLKSFGFLQTDVRERRKSGILPIDVDGELRTGES